jgi:hypothetical protein
MIAEVLEQSDNIEDARHERAEREYSLLVGTERTVAIAKEQWLMDKYEQKKRYVLANAPFSDTVSVNSAQSSPYPRTRDMQPVRRRDAASLASGLGAAQYLTSVPTTAPEMTPARSQTSGESAGFSRASPASSASTPPPAEELRKKVGMATELSSPGTQKWWYDLNRIAVVAATPSLDIPTIMLEGYNTWAVIVC